MSKRYRDVPVTARVRQSPLRGVTRRLRCVVVLKVMIAYSIVAWCVFRWRVEATGKIVAQYALYDRLSVY